MLETVESASAGRVAGAPGRVLVVTNMYPVPDRPVLGIFVKEQVESLRAQGLEVDVLFVDGPGNKLNYLGGILRFRRQVARRRYDLVHAHYVFSGVIALAQWGLPVVTTFHSGEVLGLFQRTLSRWSLPFRPQHRVSDEVMGSSGPLLRHLRRRPGALAPDVERRGRG
jgi:hypothetical protein